MNKPFYILFFVLSSVLCKAQTNLIYNADFEQYDTCPTGTSVPWDQQINHCINWTMPTYATSDYFNSCSAGGATLPNNVVGYQPAYSGNGYCGFIAYSLGGSGGCYAGSYWWEYIQGKFINPLITGHKYHIGFYVSLAEGSNIALRGLGFYISTTAIGNNCSTAPLSYTSQITSPAGVFLTDTANWTLIDGDYTAAGGEQYITIGKFADSLTTDTITVFNNAQPPFAYYYIDGGTAFDVTEQRPVANMFTPNNDGINDLFFMEGLTEDDRYTIYDRWGIKIFEGSYNSGWDGKTDAGLSCSDGVYYYISEQKDKETKKGFIHLLR